MAVSRQGNRDLRPWYEKVRDANTKAKARGMRHGYRSGLEEKNAVWLQANGIPVLYETLKIKYSIPESGHTYTPDFPVDDGAGGYVFIIETKGKLEGSDRAKHLLIKAQHPDYDIRFVFSRPSDPIYKGSSTSQADWANKHGFKWAAKLVPLPWIEEAKKARALAAKNIKETA